MGTHTWMIIVLITDTKIKVSHTILKIKSTLSLI